jgi:hypothetical protein
MLEACGWLSVDARVAMARREWLDREKAEALAALDANGGNIAQTSRQLGIPRSTLTLWRSGGVTEEVADICHLKKADLADRLETIAHLILDGLPDKVGASSLKDAAVAFGVVVDKRQLLLEKPTSITRDDGITDTDRAERVAALLDAARERRAGQPAAVVAAVH